MYDGSPSFNQNHKTCSACRKTRPLADFSKHAGRKDGLESKCKKCTSAYGRKWYRRVQAATDGVYSTWVAMKARCHNPKHDSFPNYGGRGITVCDEWRESFEAFASWAKRNGYHADLQIDRISNDKGYSPDNCRFVSVRANHQNKRPRTRCIRTNPSLSEQDVREVRQLLALGLSQRFIGREFGVTHGTIGAIKRGCTWKDIH